MKLTPEKQAMINLLKEHQAFFDDKEYQNLEKQIRKTSSELTIVELQTKITQGKAISYLYKYKDYLSIQGQRVLATTKSEQVIEDVLKIVHELIQDELEQYADYLTEEEKMQTTDLFELNKIVWHRLATKALNEYADYLTEEEKIKLANTTSRTVVNDVSYFIRSRLTREIKSYYQDLTEEEKKQLDNKPSLKDLKALLHEVKIRKENRLKVIELNKQKVALAPILLDLINKIETNYPEYLNEEVKLKLNNDDLEITVRELINNIWHDYLTNPIEHQQDFKYLVRTLNAMELLDYGSFEDIPFDDQTSHSLTILEAQDINQYRPGEYGYIMDVDWLATKSLVLPIDFTKGSKYIKGGIKPCGVYSISLGEGNISLGHYTALDLANRNDYPFADINKRMIQENYQMTPFDERHILGSTIWTIIFKLDLPDEKLKEYSNKYGKYILARYYELMEQNLYQDDNFETEIMHYITQKENIIVPKL